MDLTFNGTEPTRELKQIPTKLDELRSQLLQLEKNIFQLEEAIIPVLGSEMPTAQIEVKKNSNLTPLASILNEQIDAVFVMNEKLASLWRRIEL